MYARILVPIDDSPTSQRGLDEALRLAVSLGSSVRLLHVVDARLLLVDFAGYGPPQQLLDDWRTSGERLVAEASAQARALGLKVDGDVRCDPGMRVCDAILAESRECGAELIVMGTHGRRGLVRVALGSDAELVLRDSAVPVLLVRQGDEGVAG